MSSVRESLRKSLNNWFSGPFLHLHLSPEDQTFSGHLSHEEYQFTQSAALTYLQRLTDCQSVILHVSNHSQVDLWRRGDTKPPCTISDSQVNVASSDLLYRHDHLRQRPDSDRFLTGVEADIHCPDGTLGLNDLALRETDVVIASCHYYFTSGFASGEPAVNEIITSLVSASSHPRVDILGHPTQLPKNIISSFTPNSFRPVIDNLISRSAAFEINLADCFRSGPASDLLFSILETTAPRDMLFTIGSDFHHARYYGFPGYFDQSVTTGNVNQAFDHHRQFWHRSLFTQLGNLIRRLESIGITPDRIVNSNPDRFSAWYAQRQKIKSAT